uniref:Uncharacterized protein n=1 Tax=Vitis vinifera TaxID=29760 RepID=A5BYY4_VITVI|nr:hypothetical protein VITISV_021703 [Vitis vinifera]
MTLLSQLSIITAVAGSSSLPWTWVRILIVEELIDGVFWLLPICNDQLIIIKEKDKGVKINDDLRKKLSKKWNALSKVEKEDFMTKSKESSKQYLLQKGVGPKLFYHEHISFQQKFPPLYTRPFPRIIIPWGDDEVLDMKQRLKKIGGYANDNMTMEGENEEDEKFEIHPNKDVIKREKYTTLKGLFLGSREKPLRELEERTKSDILSSERSLEEKDDKKGNEHYVDTLSIDKLRTKDVNGKNEDACATSIEVHIIPDENVDILPLSIKRTRKDYGKLYPSPPGGHTTLSNILPERRSTLSGYIVRIISRKTQAMLSHLRQPVTARIPLPTERKDRSDGKSPPTISDSRLQGDDDSAITSRTS